MGFMGFPVFEIKFQNGLADPPTPGPKLDCSSSCVFRQYLCFSMKQFCKNECSVEVLGQLVGAIASIEKRLKQDFG